MLRRRLHNGAYGANFNPHCHGLITDGAFSKDGEFLPIPSLDASAVMQLFRRLLLLRLHKAERLSESFMQNLLSWVHPGFSVFAGPPVEAAEITALESQARYITLPYWPWMLSKNSMTAVWFWKRPPIQGPARLPSRWIRSNGFTASRPISPIRDAIVKDSTGPIPTAGGFPWRLKMTKQPACRQPHFRSGTIRIVPGKPAAHGLA